MKTVTGTLITARDVDSAERTKRLRTLAWLMDNSIPLPGGFRIGLDAIIGLVPGIGDAIGAVISAYIINEARGMGAPRSVLFRMMSNVMIETVIGADPGVIRRIRACIATDHADAPRRGLAQLVGQLDSELRHRARVAPGARGTASSRLAAMLGRCGSVLRIAFCSACAESVASAYG